MVDTKLYEGARKGGGEGGSREGERRGEGGREKGREGGQVTGHSSLSVGGKTEVLTGIEYQAPTEEEGEGGGEGHQMPLAVDFPQAPLVIIHIFTIIYIATYVIYCMLNICIFIL